MINKNQRCKMVTLLKSLKKYLFRIHIQESIFKDGFWNVNRNISKYFFNDFNKVTI